MKHIYYVLAICLLFVSSAYGQVNRASESGTFRVDTAGTLSSLIGEDNMDNYSSLTITGDLNGDDIAFIRSMAKNELETLDLSGANIVEGGDAYYIAGRYQYYTSKDTIGPNMFYGTYLEKIVLPNSVVYIGDEALGKCNYLKDVTIGSSTKALGKMSLYYCTKLEEITIPGNVEDLGAHTFYYCSNLKKVNLNEGLKKIGTLAFYFCTQLSDITLPSTLEVIDTQAFFNCQSLTKAHISASVTTIGEGAFDRCVSLAAFDVDENNATYCDVDGVLYSKDQTVLYRAPIAKEYGDFTLPEKVVEIKMNAFYGCNGLTSLTMSDNVATLGTGIFNGCKNLASVKLSSALTEIPDGTFYSCSALTGIDFPAGIKSIGSSAFMMCTSLASVELPEGCTTIADAAFYSCSSITRLWLPSTIEMVDYVSFYGCKGLESITCLAVRPPETGSTPFGGGVNTETCALNVPEASVEDYKAAKYWQDFLINAISSGVNESFVVNDGEVVYYDLNGRKLAEPQRGVNIVRKADGTTYKVLVK